MSLFQIKNRWSGNVQFECELTADIEDMSFGVKLGFAVKKAFELGADLRDADLRGVELRGIELRGVDFRGVDFRGVELRGVELRGVDLRGADLRGVELRGVELRGADLRDVDFRGVELRGVDLRAFKADIFMVLLNAIPEVPNLLLALKQGRVHGSSYSGPCACLVGTIANSRHCNTSELPDALKPDSSRPAEQFFMSIRKGDTPETSAISKIVVEWIEEFIQLISVVILDAKDTASAAFLKESL